MTFQDFSLEPRLLDAVQKSAFTQPTPVQEQAIPPITKGADVMACAQTGTGKTAAYVLPLLHRLLTNPPTEEGKGARVLILTPTRELAAQVCKNIDTFAKGLPIRSGVLVGGVPYGPQIRLLNHPLDILVATPGRLMDHMNTGRVDFTRIETIVFDEADRMLDMGFLKPVETIMAETPEARQTLLFSATYSNEVERVVKRFLKDPTRISLAPSTQQHESISQKVMHASGRDHKVTLLNEILQDTGVWQAIVFIKTKHAADKMAKKLGDMGFDTAALHGDMRQSARSRVIRQMHDGKVRVLVATDVAARGLDVKELSHVINFDLPQVAEDYIHRIGRTGRAGESGVAISLVGPEDRSLLRDIERLIGRKIDAEGEPSTAPMPTRKPGGRNGGRSAGRSSERSGSRNGGGGYRAGGNSDGKPKRSKWRSEEGSRSNGEGRGEGRSQERSFSRGASKFEDKSDGKFAGKDAGKSGSKGGDFKARSGGDFKSRTPRDGAPRDRSAFKEGGDKQERTFSHGASHAGSRSGSKDGARKGFGAKPRSDDFKGRPNRDGASTEGGQNKRRFAGDRPAGSGFSGSGHTGSGKPAGRSGPSKSGPSRSASSRSDSGPRKFSSPSAGKPKSGFGPRRPGKSGGGAGSTPRSSAPKW